jgi:AcrR family transcriptional regulator
VREWVPVGGTAKARLARLALDAFGAHGYDGVGVADLARKAGVTTGSLYHHFGSKLGLYTVARTEVERRVLDRMEGAAAARADDGGLAPLGAALLVGFDHAAERGFTRLLAERHPGGDEDPVEALLTRLAPEPTLARLLAAAWRAALAAVADGTPSPTARGALAALTRFGAPAPA